MDSVMKGLMGQCLFRIFLARTAPTPADTRTNFILPETNVPELYITAAIVRVYMYFVFTRATLC